jgi:acyl-CoA dehydrogenase
MEMWKSANMAFSLCPMLTNGAIESIKLRGTDEQKAAYLPKMVSGEWTGTMNLTEPQAGSDLAAVRTRAVPQGDGTYKIFGQKIFITYGEHDMTDNIIHLVLARLPDAPEGVKGISLFVVPKFLLNADGTPGERNDVHCVSIEHKLGIHASPTAVLAFGDKGGAIGTLVGEANRGLEYMFIMMNEARFAVGMEGLALSERAYQQALAYAKDRVQGTEAGVRGGPKVSIIHHADVRRMLMSMKSQIEAQRALAYVVGAATDMAHHHPDEAVRAQNQAFGSDDPGGQGLAHREQHRAHLHRRAGAWRHGLHRGNRRCPALPRRPHHLDLRRHHGDPGQRPDRPQDRPRERPDREGSDCRDAQGRGQSGRGFG